MAVAPEEEMSHEAPAFAGFDSRGALDHREIGALAHGRRPPKPAPAKAGVERARILWHASRGTSAPVIAATLHIDAETVRRRVRRFNAEGLAALEDHHRCGCPSTYTPQEVATVIATALTAPRTLGLPFAAWTLDRLAAYLNEHKGIAMKRSRIDEILRQEGLRWRKQETWFGARVDPDFAQKRGRSRLSTLPRPPAVL
jgi:transposase